MAALSCPKQSLAVYRPRRPEKTALFQVIKKNYLPWRKIRDDQENPVPHYIENVFQKYLGCGILAKGFACAHCDGYFLVLNFNGLQEAIGGKLQSESLKSEAEMGPIYLG